MMTIFYILKHYLRNEKSYQTLIRVNVVNNGVTATQFKREEPISCQETQGGKGPAALNLCVSLDPSWDPAAPGRGQALSPSAQRCRWAAWARKPLGESWRRFGRGPVRRAKRKRPAVSLIPTTTQATPFQPDLLPRPTLDTGPPEAAKWLVVSGTFTRLRGWRSLLSASAMTFRGDLPVSTQIFPAQMSTGPVHSPEPLLTPIPLPNPPTSLARLWAHDDWEPFHLQIKLALSNWACGENCASLTRLSSSVCSVALDSTVFSKLFQTPEIYLNYLTCENKTAQERKLLSLSEWASESRVPFPRASLCSDFWLQTWPGNKEKKN